MINQEVASELLGSAGLVVDIANDGVQAVARVAAGSYGLVLMDMQMPEMDGLEATRRLRAAGHTLPIVAMTANAFGDDRRVCLDASMNDHIAKPVDPELLYATVSRWLTAATDRPPAHAPRAPAADTALEGAAGMDALRQIADFDVDQGLRLFADQTAIYCRVLRRFATTYASGMADIDEALADAGLAGLGPAGHSLRGASASIGALGLERLARRLEAFGTMPESPESQRAVALETQARLIELSRLILAAVGADSAGVARVVV